jgi:hypothetical protein
MEEPEEKTYSLTYRLDEPLEPLVPTTYSIDEPCSSSDVFIRRYRSKVVRWGGWVS